MSDFVKESHDFVKQPCLICEVPTHIKYLGDWLCPEHLHEFRRQRLSIIGLKPRFVWEEKRLQEIQAAIARYIEAALPIPLNWVQEYNELIERGRKAWRL